MWREKWASANTPSILEQLGKLCILAGIENHKTALAAVSRAGILRLDFGRPTEELGAGLHVKCMQALVTISVGILRHSNQVEGVIGALLAIQHRRVGDTDFGRDLAAAVIVAGSFTGQQRWHPPGLRLTQRRTHKCCRVR